MSFSLLPATLELELDLIHPSSSSHLPVVQANLMPFHIDYTGPAPIDTFLVLRQPADSTAATDSQLPTPTAETETEPADPSSEDGEGLLSAFRGRAIQSSSLPLPQGYVGRLVTVSSTTTAKGEGPAGPSSSTSSVGREGDEGKDGRANNADGSSRRARRVPPPARKPAKMQKFSMDSDDEVDAEDGPAEEEGNERGEAGWGDRVGAASSFGSELEPSSVLDRPEGLTDGDGEATGTTRTRREAVQTLRPVASLADDAIRVWGPDGPIDRGDDVFFRTVREWVGVVGAELHAI